MQPLRKIETEQPSIKNKMRGGCRQIRPQNAVEVPDCEKCEQALTEGALPGPIGGSKGQDADKEGDQEPAALLPITSKLSDSARGKHRGTAPG